MKTRPNIDIEVRRLVRKILSEGSSYNQNNLIEWVQDEPKEWYAVQKNEDNAYSADDAIGWIYKNLLLAVTPGNPGSMNNKWAAIEPFYGEDFEKATEILLQHWREKYGIDIGKRYELPGGLYAIETYNTFSSQKFQKKLIIYFDDGELIGSYYPLAKSVIYPIPKRPTQSMTEHAEDLKRAAFLAFMKHQQRSTPKQG